MQIALNQLKTKACEEAKTSKKVNENILLEWKRQAREILNSHSPVQKPQEESKTVPVMEQVDPSINECDRISADLI